jgi:ubiquinone/menaquinone biosynthesis C-methylase UbiE
MGFYQNYIVPHLVNLAMRNRELQPYRERVTAGADGRVLEVGIGSGLNLAFYPAKVREIVGLEPVPRLLSMAKRAVPGSLHLTLVEGSAETIPLDESSIDTVVTTWTLCTIPDVQRALLEMRRVLKPSGELLFVEHGLAPEEKVRRWQNRLNPFWKRIAGGCQLNRPIRDLIEKAGFNITEIETGYIKGPRPMTFFYRGRAKPRD